MKLFTITTAAALLMASTAMANPNIMFIVDASGSMKEKVEGKSRMDAAKEVLIRTLEKMPEDANLGLMVYGHRKAKDCSDIELVSPIGGDDANKLAMTIATLNAKGETPIAESIKEASKSFSAFERQKNKVILVTDGLEECQGDPCAAAKEVAASGLEVAVDVVGFTLGSEEAKAVQCITEATGGKYYDAPDATTLTAALEEAAEPVVEPEPEISIVFEDTFEGEDLSTDWEIINPNPDSYIVDEGKLMVIMPGQQKMPVEDENFPNLFRSIHNMPDGDWTIEVDLSMEVHTGREKAYIGVMDDAQNWIAMGIESHEETSFASVNAYLEKMESGKTTRVQETIKQYNAYMPFDLLEPLFNEAYETFHLKLEKTGREYTYTLSYKEGEEEKVLKNETVKMLRPKTSLFIALGQGTLSGTDHDSKPLESYVNIDSIKVSGVKAVE